jgi:predicted aconitase with swiveling domain
VVVTLVEMLTGGDAEGPVLRLEQPVSFWGGVDGSSGEIVDPAHPQRGEVVAGKILVMPHGRGSSSSSSVLAELLRVGAGPAAIILDEPDAILVGGAVVATELYHVTCPIGVGESTAGTGERWAIRQGLLSRLEDP